MAQNQDISLSAYKAGNSVSQLAGNKSFIPNSITSKWQIDNMEVLAIDLPKLVFGQRWSRFAFHFHVLRGSDRK